MHEARLLDHRRFDEWLSLWTDDATYFVPVRVPRRMPATDVVDDIGLFDDNNQSLTLRVRRLSTEVAWAEDPPRSRDGSYRISTSSLRRTTRCGSGTTCFYTAAAAMVASTT